MNLILIFIFTALAPLAIYGFPASSHQVRDVLYRPGRPPKLGIKSSRIYYQPRYPSFETSSPEPTYEQPTTVVVKSVGAEKIKSFVAMEARAGKQKNNEAEKSSNSANTKSEDSQVTQQVGVVYVNENLNKQTKKKTKGKKPKTGVVYVNPVLNESKQGNNREG